MPQKTSNKVKVFISKKEKDARLTEKIKDSLSVYGAGRLAFFDSQMIPPGEDWLRCIKRTLAESDLLLLLFTGPSEKWDWPLYEVGIFTPIANRKPKPVICWYPPVGEPPEPLQHVQAVPAETEAMAAFLKAFYGTSEITRVEPPLNKPFAENEEAILALAEKICEIFVPDEGNDHEAIFYNRRIKLMLDPARVNGDGIPAEAEVEADPTTLEIFDLQSSPPNGGLWTWAKLEEMMKACGSTEWIEELSEAVRRACQGEGLRPPAETLSSLSSQKVYRATVHSRKLHAANRMSLEVLFIQQPSRDQVTLPVKATTGRS